MLVGIVSDTHDDLSAVDQAVETFESRGVDTVIHCGDIVAPFAATPFDRSFAFHAVRGNNDGEWALAQTIDAFGTYHGEFAHLTLDDREFAVYHGTSEPIVEALLASGAYDYVCRGHTHERTLDDLSGTVEINPGGLPFPQAPADPAVAILDTTAPVGPDAVETLSVS
ncbi:metallophosphoesterase [Halococcoides cellulosivorans]|uniref:Phosphoesterase n=1 Tax=Halococcoides cellulosivorans TaxID=1679096 RepID=A0A2R4X0N0_9EURY|nr:metallophosphoesterase [Halococcoides cellulosivorans]AWB27362.1 YfcE family phosphodiesterase [Halococcoides cellulosivorans]